MIIYPSYERKGKIFYEETPMESEFNGIERRLNELSERLGRLQALKTKPRLTFDLCL